MAPSDPMLPTMTLPPTHTHTHTPLKEKRETISDSSLLWKLRTEKQNKHY